MADSHSKAVSARGAPQGFIRKWRVKHCAVADSLGEAGDRLFTFTRLLPSQWKSARTTNAIERLHVEFKRRIKTQTVLPSADTAAMLFWALLAFSYFENAGDCAAQNSNQLRDDTAERSWDVPVGRRCCPYLTPSVLS